MEKIIKIIRDTRDFKELIEKYGINIRIDKLVPFIRKEARNYRNEYQKYNKSIN